ncbi:multidrug transporter [Vanrija albida]|uniref:Multidrug transporter n=1 Tax=Vanrija albida TaxID=181172 RepID=A0ABR3Q6S0_9TREE
MGSRAPDAPRTPAPPPIAHEAGATPAPPDHGRRAWLEHAAAPKPDLVAAHSPPPDSRMPSPSPSPSPSPAPTLAADKGGDEVADATAEAGAPAPTPAAAKPYSAFPTSTRWLIALLGGVGGIFSPISSNIFVPSIPAIARDFNRSNQDITLALTVYLVFQAFTPSLFGAASDSFGRRPLFLLTMVIYIGANLGLGFMPVSKYWLLLFLRALQATGGSAVIAIGSGAVADIAEPKERGKFQAIFQMGAMVGPAVGPLLGGVFAQAWGWRAMFYFLAAASGTFVVTFLFFFPETLRSLVGDGSIPPPLLNASPVQMYQRWKRTAEPELVDRPPRRPYQPLSAFTILFVPEIFLIYFVVSLLYLEFYCVIAIFSTALEEKYHLNELQIGLCYLPSGIGTICSTLAAGRLVDYYYGREVARVGGDYRAKPDTFGVERARTAVIWPGMSVFITASVALGWCIQVKAPLAALLVVSFFPGLGVAVIAVGVVYGQDVFPGKGAAASASLNFVRCAFGAIGTGVIQIMYQNLGAGWSFVLLSGLCAASLPLLLVVIRYAPRWRAWRRHRALTNPSRWNLFLGIDPLDARALRDKVAREGSATEGEK